MAFAASTLNFSTSCFEPAYSLLQNAREACPWGASPGTLFSLTFGLISYPPKVELSKLVNSLKGVSSRMLRKEHPDIVQRYWKDVLWSRSYFAASCGGAPISIIKQYIEQQRTPA